MTLIVVDDILSLLQNLNEFQDDVAEIWKIIYRYPLIFQQGGSEVK